MKPKKRKRFIMYILTLLVLLLAATMTKNGRFSPFPPDSFQPFSQISLLPLELVAGLVASPPQKLSVPAPKPVERVPAVANKPLALGWILDTGAASITQVLDSTPGLDVLSPKWFHVDGLGGAVAGAAERTVIHRVHAANQQVWAVVDNGFNSRLSHSILRYQDQQAMLIARIVKLATSYQLDGINLDFEGLNPDDRWNYTRFVNSLAKQLHARGISLSIDLPPDYVPGQNTGPYNHAALAKAADYLVLMGYDEHWLGDADAGPTASLPWVTQAVNDFLETGVPANKLILGIPFYTESWTVNKNGKVLTSTALSLYESKRLVENAKSNPVWDARDGVYYTAFHSQGARQEIWLEDPRTLMLFTEIARRQRLAGIAAWYLGLESPSTWLSVVHTLRSPQGKF